MAKTETETFNANVEHIVKVIGTFLGSFKSAKARENAKYVDWSMLADITEEHDAHQTIAATNRVAFVAIHPDEAYADSDDVLAAAWKEAQWKYPEAVQDYSDRHTVTLLQRIARGVGQSKTQTEQFTSWQNVDLLRRIFDVLGSSLPAKEDAPAAHIAIVPLTSYHHDDGSVSSLNQKKGRARANLVMVLYRDHVRYEVTVAMREELVGLDVRHESRPASLEDVGL